MRLDGRLTERQRMKTGNKTLLSMQLIGAVAASLLALTGAPLAQAATPAPRFKMVVLAELKEDGKGPADDQHRPYVEAARIWLNQLAKDSNFTVTYLETPDTFTDAMLADVDIIWQMNYAPYGWPDVPRLAFEKYMNSGKGGWLGVHHATLYGPHINNLTWPFFFKLIGQINYTAYIPSFAAGDVHVEEAAHPIFQGVPATFNVTTEEWYTWDKNPRDRLHILGNVDEKSYKPTSNVKMGDHPVIWTNDSVKTRNLYVFMGHHPNLFQNQAYMTLMKNAIFWVANKPAPTAVSKPAANRAARPGKSALRIDGAAVTFTSLAGSGQEAAARDAVGRTRFQSDAKKPSLSPGEQKP
jgi:type 1 glutamine amidotransferase